MLGRRRTSRRACSWSLWCCTAAAAFDTPKAPTRTLFCLGTPTSTRFLPHRPPTYARVRSTYPTHTSAQQSEDAGETSHIKACQLLESVVLHCRGRIRRIGKLHPPTMLTSNTQAHFPMISLRTHQPPLPALAPTLALIPPPKITRTSSRQSEDAGETSHIKACQLLESVVLHCRGRIDAHLPAILELLFLRLNTVIKTRQLQLTVIEVVRVPLCVCRCVLLLSFVSYLCAVCVGFCVLMRLCMFSALRVSPRHPRASLLVSQRRD